MVDKLSKYVTPGMLNYNVIANGNEDLLNPKEHLEYHTGVGMLLYLMKYSHPDLANAVQQLSKGV